MVIYGGNTTEILWEIHRKFIGNMTGNITEILRKIPQLNKTDRRKNCGHLHTETTLKSRLFPWLSFGFSQSKQGRFDGNVVTKMWKDNTQQSCFPPAQSTLYFSFNLNTCTKVQAYVQHDLAIAGFLLRLKSVCIKHSNLNTTSPIITSNLLI